jgi:anthranilate phosphoribosyltransferase
MTQVKTAEGVAQEILDAIYGTEAEVGFLAVSAATATMVAGYMQNWGYNLDAAEQLLDDMHEEAREQLRESWGKVRRNDC